MWEGGGHVPLMEINASTGNRPLPSIGSAFGHYGFDNSIGADIVGFKAQVPSVAKDVGVTVELSGSARIAGSALVKQATNPEQYQRWLANTFASLSPPVRVSQGAINSLLAQYDKDAAGNIRSFTARSSGF
jgi:hypothetical protein